MPRLFKHDINFLGNRKIFYLISVALLVISILAIAINGLHFGIEFSGGTSTTFDSTGEITTEEMREAFAAAGDPEAVIQTTEVNGQQGFLVRTSITDPDVAAAHAAQVADQLGLDTDSYQVSVVGPDWGKDVKNRSIIAFFVSIIAIIIYIGIRFEYKMGLTAIAALIHDLVIVVGIYALVGREITPNVVAALLTIMGYSLYDTVVVFHRITDNTEHEEIRTSFWKMANHSINQVFTRTINTTLTSLIPVLCMLFFGGATLTDFAFAMAIGLVIGSYSSIAVASPLYVTWKSREPRFARMNRRHPDDLLPAREIRKRQAAGIALVGVDESVEDDKPVKKAKKNKNSAAEKLAEEARNNREASSKSAGSSAVDAAFERAHAAAEKLEGAGAALTEANAADGADSAAEKAADTEAKATADSKPQQKSQPKKGSGKSGSKKKGGKSRSKSKRKH